MRNRRGSLYAFFGACGGAGTSTLAAAFAQVLHTRTGTGVLLDLDGGGGGLEVALGIEAAAGARWPELSGARGEVDGRGLIAALPKWGVVPVISQTRHHPAPPPDEVVLDVCAGMLRVGESVVADLPRVGAWSEAVRVLLRDADSITLVCPARLPAAAGAVACLSALSALGGGALRQVALAVADPGPGRVDAADLSQLTGAPVGVRVRRRHSVATRSEVGAGGPFSRRSPMMRAAARLLRSMGALDGAGPAPAASNTFAGVGGRA